MRRRDFITLIGGAAIAWPLVAWARQADRTRRVGVLMGYAETDPEAKALLAEFTRAVSELGWIEGRNLRMDVRWAPGNTDLMRKFAKELVSLQPDVILTNSTPVTAALKRETSTIPIVFAVAADPVGSGFVTSLPRPGGNVTGFSSMEGSMASKWLELLTAIAPAMDRGAFDFVTKPIDFQDSMHAGRAHARSKRRDEIADRAYQSLLRRTRQQYHRDEATPSRC
jgi:putative tryptophan/tyrosine transport system substrate-binding protein